MENIINRKYINIPSSMKEYIKEAYEETNVNNKRICYFDTIDGLWTFPFNGSNKYGYSRKALVEYIKNKELV